MIHKIRKKTESHWLEVGCVCVCVGWWRGAAQEGPSQIGIPVFASTGTVTH